MNILHTETLYGWGGQQNKVLKELNATRALGHSAFLLCNPESDIAQHAREDDIPVFEFPINKLTYFQSIPFALNLIKKLKIDIVITHSSSDSWMGGIAGRISSRNVIVMRERHNMHTIVGWPSKWLHRKVFHRLLAVSQRVKDYLVDEIKVSPDRVLILNSVVNVAAFENTRSEIRSELGIPPEALVVGMFSILRVNKGIYDFLELIKKILPNHPNTYAVFGGKTNPDRIREVMHHVENAGIDPSRVKWTGFRRDVANVIKGFDIFVFPSHSEGWPNVLLEAMACKLPVVTYNVRPMSDMVKNKVTGLMVPFQDFEALAQRVEQLLADSRLRGELGQAAHAMVKSNYDELHLKENIRKVLEMIAVG